MLAMSRSNAATTRSTGSSTVSWVSADNQMQISPRKSPLIIPLTSQIPGREWPQLRRLGHIDLGR